MIAIPNSVLVNSCVNADPVSEHFSGSKTKSICTLYKALADVTYVNRYCVRKRYSVYTCIKRTVETKKSKRVSIEKPKKSCFVTMPSLSDVSVNMHLIRSHGSVSKRLDCNCSFSGTYTTSDVLNCLANNGK